MAAVYPGTVATIAANKADGTTSATDHPAHHNQLAEELVAVQTTLGTSPAGSHASVKNRLAAAAFTQPFYDPWNTLLTGVGASAPLAETMPFWATSSANTTLASARVRLMGGLVLPAGQAITGIGFICGSTAMSGGTHAWASLIRASDRVYLRSSADDTTATWTAGTARAYPLASTYTPSVDTPVWIGYTAVATTAPSLVGAPVNANVAAITPLRTALGDSGLSAPPADGATHGVPAINTSAVYAWVY